MKITECNIRVSWDKKDDLNDEFLAWFDRNDIEQDYRTVEEAISSFRDDYGVEFDRDHNEVLIYNDDIRGILYLKITPSYEAISDAWSDLEKESK